MNPHNGILACLRKKNKKNPQRLHKINGIQDVPEILCCALYLGLGYCQTVFFFFVMRILPQNWYTNKSMPAMSFDLSQDLHIF